MPPLDTKSFEKKVRVRRLRPKDYEAVVELQKKCFPGMKPWSREQWDSQQKIFPQGQLCVVHDGRIVASSSSLIVDSDLHQDWHDWRVMADGGFIRNHDVEGDTLYGIEIMVDPEFRGLRLARRLYDARKQLAREHNVPRIVVGGRIPGYGKVAERMSAREYVEKVMAKSLYDPVLTTQTSNGFVLKRLIPDYMPSDVDSRGYATYLEWTNLDYHDTPSQQWRAVRRVRVCAVQYKMRKVSSFEEFARQCEYFTDVASDYRSDFVVFPELHTTQLLSLIKSRSPAEAARKLARYAPRYLELFTRLAIKYNLNIVGGSTFTVEDDRLYNASVLFRRNGTAVTQYKLHVTPNERKWWGVVPGSRLEVFDTDCGRVCIQVCYDVEFPELSRMAAAKGAQIVFVPFCTDERHGYLRVRSCAQARCIENHLYVVLAGTTGNLPFVDNADVHYAQSCILTPADLSFSRDGIAAECTPNIETVVIHDLDLQLLKRHRLEGTVQNWNDRRTDLYRIRYQEDGKSRDV